MKKLESPEDDTFTPGQLAKGLAILAAAVLWPVIPLLAAAFGLYEIHKLALRDEWDDVWQLLIAPAVLGVALWVRSRRTGKLIGSGNGWMPVWVERAFVYLLGLCLALFIVALAIDVFRT